MKRSITDMGRSEPRQMIKKALYTTVVLLVAGFVYYQSRDLLAGPQIYIESPRSGETVESSTVEIRGKAYNISEITLNGRGIYVERDGEFREKLLLSYGYNIITVAGTDRFGRDVEERVELVYK